MLQISRIEDSSLNLEISKSLRELLNDAFESDFAEEDWQHTFGGIRFVGRLHDELVAHGAVVPRWMKIDGEQMYVGYVEGIAVASQHWRKGYGSLLIAKITEYCRSEFSLSLLSTDEKEFYRKQGWLDFEGETYILENGQEKRSKDEDEGLMYIYGKNFYKSAPKKAVCESRDGDAW
ncbi:MAG: GNAT family N-acetyltransferase [Candidatus Nanopelagicaceae bacterium]|nr:GNAT family N-acetyltransferase [Candidatus Nanopelagicaceae bacterium]